MESLTIRICRGVESGTCRFGLNVPEGIVSQVESCLEQSGWGEFLAGVTGGTILSHQRFSVGISACPNACARPQIADFGLICAETPVVAPEDCIACGICTHVCPENAAELTMEGHVVFSAETCLKCGICARECPQDAIKTGESGWRVMVGGRLGRRPRLADELPGLHTSEQVIAILDKAVSLYMMHWKPRTRLGDVIANMNSQTLWEALGI